MVGPGPVELIILYNNNSLDFKNLPAENDLSFFSAKASYWIDFNSSLPVVLLDPFRSKGFGDAQVYELPLCPRSSFPPKVRLNCLISEKQQRKKNITNNILILINLTNPKTRKHYNKTKNDEVYNTSRFICKCMCLANLALKIFFLIKWVIY